MYVLTGQGSLLKQCKHRTSLLNKSRKSKLTFCVVSEPDILPVSATSSDVYAQSDWLMTFVGLRSDLASQLDDGINPLSAKPIFGREKVF